MNRAQKIAWFNLIVIAASLTISGAAVGILNILYGMPTALGGLGFLGIGALVGLSPFLFRKKPGQFDFDERDQLIRLRALFFASFVSLWCLIAQCVLQVFKVGPRGSVPVGTLVGTVYGALVSFVIGKSLWTLIEYRRGKK